MRFSLCMIVKNEENVLARCLDSVADLMDEIIIVDTGSTDATKEIALRYTDKVYDFVWINDFAAARNFACSKATGDYIYTADADEVIDEVNRKRFMQLKEALVPEVEIVQMYYVQDISKATTENFEKEYRPKLFKRLREFTWIDPVHESLRIDPVVFDSDVEILHLPEGDAHASRDLKIFCGLGGQVLSKKLYHMYAVELFKSGTREDFLQAVPQFAGNLERDVEMDTLRESFAVLARASLYAGDIEKMFGYVVKDVAAGASAEVCCVLGEYYEGKADVQEAAMWYLNARNEAECILDLRCGGEIPEKRLQALGF